MEWTLYLRWSEAVRGDGEEVEGEMAFEFTFHHLA